MSKAFTIITALLIAGAAGVAGYVYYAGDSVPCPLQAVASVTSSSASDEADCPLCQAAKKKSCCSGESLAKHIALGGSAKSEEPSCCAGETDPMLTTAALIGGTAFSCSAKAHAGCCDEAPSVAGLTGLVGAVAAK